MALYRINNERIAGVERTTFSKQGFKERQDLQRLLKDQIEIISPNTLIVAEEFGEWEDSRRRIDLLGIDKEANLIVIELKRTEDGGHMELQALRYAAMISMLTFDKLVEIYADHLEENKEDAYRKLQNFLQDGDNYKEEIGKEVKIVLISAEFSKELTTTVMWLRNEYKVDVKCIRLHPYVNNGEVFLDIQTVIPLPEVADYQIKISEKKQEEREIRESSKDYTKYNLTILNESYTNLSKRGLMFYIISKAVKTGIRPQQLMETMTWRQNRLFKEFEGTLNELDVHSLLMQDNEGGQIPRIKRYFSNEEELLYSDNKTYVLSNQWGVRTIESVEAIKSRFPELNIQIKAVL